MKGPEILTATTSFPKAYYFRSAETGAPAGVPFEEWEREFIRLGGIQGKTLGEEVPGRETNIPYFTRYKDRHPDKLVLLHFNGNARDPTFESDEFFAGHWLYFEGSTIIDSIPAKEDETEISVTDTSLFRTDVGRYHDRNEDIGLCTLDENGEPNWNQSEQVRLVSKAPEEGVIRVERGCHGTTPRRFTANEAYAAAHVHEGPWGDGHLMWHYNHSAVCPRDERGQTCTDVLAKDIVERFRPGGRLEHFDGIEFDVLHDTPTYISDELLEGRGVDTTGDGRADAGHVDGVNQYGIGVYELCRRLRSQLGEERLILADAHKTDHQRCFGVLNGIETEVFPGPGEESWSTAVNRHYFWNANARRPSFSYMKSLYSSDREMNDVRLALATAQLLDAGVFIHDHGEQIQVWDELRKGAERELGWLGLPRDDTVHLARRTDDHLDGAGRTMTSEFVDRFTTDGVSVDSENDTLRISRPENDGDMSFCLRDVPTAGGYLLVSLSIRAAEMTDYPEGYARQIRVTIPADATADGDRRKEATWINPTWFDASFFFQKLDRNRDSVDLEFEVDGSQPIWLSGVTAHAHTDAMIRGFEDGLVLANPSHHEYTFDLKELAPDRSYRRLVGSPEQDPEINDGSIVSNEVTLPPRDGLFLAQLD